MRRALFDAGRAEIARRPVPLVTVQDLTDRADVAKGAFYLHFDGKDAFLLELWADVLERFRASLEDALQGCRTQRSRTEAAIRTYPRFAAADPASMRTWFRMAAFFPDEIGPPGRLAQLHRDHLHALAELVWHDARASGRRRAQLLDVLARAVVDTDPDGSTIGEARMVAAVSAALRAVERA